VGAERVGEVGVAALVEQGDGLQIERLVAGIFEDAVEIDMEGSVWFALAFKGAWAQTGFRVR
jgi:hypothetical protein